MRYFDLHCDTLTECLLGNDSLRYNTKRCVSLDRLRKFSPAIECFAVFIPDSLRGNAAAERFLFSAELLLESGAVLCRTKEELLECEAAGGVGAVLTAESGAVLGGKTENLERFSSLGLRMLTLTWNGENELGGGADTDLGLTEFGRGVLSQMSEYSVAVDLSHASDRLFSEVLEAYDGAIAASHSNARKICPHRRNLTDEQFSRIRERNGVVGLNFHRPFLSGEDAVYTDLLRHAEHFLSLSGENVLALGSDFDGAVMPFGISDVGDTEKIADLFLRNNYSETLVDKIMYQNARDFFLRILP